jgi:hypothetical protein
MRIILIMRIVLVKPLIWNMEKCMTIVKVLVAGAALVMLVASPAFAQRQGVGDKAPQVGARVHSEGVRARSGGASDRTPRAVGASRPRPSEFVRRSYGRRTGQSHARVHGEFQKIFANHLGQHGDPGASILYGCTWPDGMTPASLNEPRWSMSRSIGIGT